MMKPVGVALLVLTLLPGGAKAADRYVADGPASDLAAGGGWLSWSRSGERLAGPRKGFRRIPGGNAELSLGTDRRGRAVGLYMSCRRSGPCGLRERLMATGRTRTLARWNDGVVVRADRHRGLLAIARLRENDTLVTVKRPGRRTLRFRHRDSVRALHVIRDRVVVHATGEGFDGTLRVINVAGRRPRARTLLHDDGFDEECRCTTELNTVSASGADGRYAYWVETHVPDRFDYREDAPVLSRVVRTDLTSRRQVNELFTVPRRTAGFAVDRGRIFRVPAVAGGDVFEVTDPAWQPVGTGRRVLRVSA